ncbi:MAG: MotA/TolQ/ExbB proton channel family protein [Candidatus Babeliales bacterium]
MNTVHGNALYQLLAHSDAMTKIILFILLLSSVICWTIFLYKIIMLTIRVKQVRYALIQLKEARTIEEVRGVTIHFAKTMPGYLISKQVALLKGLLEAKGNQLLLSPAEFELLKERMEQTVDELVYNQESYLPVLSSSAAAAPLLGLLGTIWGLVHAFVSASQKQQADIVTMAPGMAEALITTFAGLLVALPSLIMYHYLFARIRYLEQLLFTLSDRVQWIVLTSLVTH